MTNSKNVPIEMAGQVFEVRPSGDISCDLPRVSLRILDEVRLAAAAVFVIEKNRELTKEQFLYWSGVRRVSEPPYAAGGR